MDKKDKEDRRHADINDRDIEYLEKSKNDEATAKQTMWSLRCFQSWCEEKKETVHFQSITKTELNRILRQFYATVKNGKGEAYGFSSYVGLRAGLNRYINDPPISRSWCLIKDTEFTTSNNVFAGVIKKLRREGRDKSSYHQAMTEADFQKIKNFQARNSNTPWGLVSKVWFDVQLHMGRRANEGNRKLKPDSFSIQQDDNGLKYVTLSFSDSTKNHKDAAEKDKDSLRGFMYEQPGNPLCPVASLEKYLSLLPPDPPAFYLHPKRTQWDSGDVWYTREPVGVNFLAGMLPRICKAAGTETIYTNHCLRSAIVQKLSNTGRETRQITSVTKQDCSVAHSPVYCQEGEMAEKQPKRRRSEEHKLKKKGSDQAKAKSCVNIGEALQRWGDLRELKGLKTDTEVALFLLDSYDKLCEILKTYTGTCKQEPAALSRLGGVAAESFEEMEVAIEDNGCHSVKNELSDPDSDTENIVDRAELNAPGAGDSCDGHVYVPVIPQRSKTSEIKLECKEEELEPWQNHTLIVHFKEEDDVGEFGDDQTDCKPDPSSLQSWAAGQHTLTPEACAVVHTSEGHQISNNPVSLSSVQSPEIFAPSSNKLQSDQSDSQTLSVPFPPLCLTVIKVEPAET